MEKIYGRLHIFPGSTRKPGTMFFRPCGYSPLDFTWNYNLNLSAMNARYFGLCLLLTLCGCKKLIEIPVPATSLTSNAVFANDATAISVLTGIYAARSESTPAANGTISSLTMYPGLSADEWTLVSGTPNLMALAYYHNALTGSVYGYGYEYWSGFYPTIASCNAAIAGLNHSNGLTPAVRQQLLGEALFLRAFFYFYLVNLFGDVAMPLSSGYPFNDKLARTPADSVYRRIVADLREAQGLLSTQWLDGTLVHASAERVRPTKWAAMALLARVCLYTGDWYTASAEADSVIGNAASFSLSSPDTAFLKASLGNNEAIWQLQPVNYGWNTEDAKAFIIPASGPGTGSNVGVCLSPMLLNAFEPGDLRRSHWVDSTIVGTSVYYYPYKYKIAGYLQPVNEYLMLLRLGELYLIRAEARARQGDLAGAAADLNLIRVRAGLAPVGVNPGVLPTIWHERQVELFAELGQRWLDLKRTGRVDSVMTVVTPQKGGVWKTYLQWYPLPVSDIQLDPNLQQNSGY